MRGEEHGRLQLFHLTALVIRDPAEKRSGEQMLKKWFVPYETIAFPAKENSKLYCPSLQADNAPTLQM